MSMSPRRFILAFATMAVLMLSACASEQAVPPPATASAVTTVLFLGDSYTAGTGLALEKVPLRWSTQLSEQLGWNEVNAGCNGSGYTSRGLQCRTTYLERIPQLTTPQPDIIFVSGGVNDRGKSEEEIVAAVDATYALLRETFPDATIYAVGSIYYTGTERPQLMQFLNDAVEAAAQREGAVFIDIGEPLLGRPDLMASDTLHPSPEGHALIKDLTLAAIAAS